jgi:DNA repair protein RecO (recombination protein O)
MAARVSETFVLRTYPFREGDLIVSFFTRDLGKLRGVARRARKPKSPFGSGLERLSHVRMAYYQRENADLANLTGCELIQSHFDLGSDYARGLALDFFTETAEHLLPEREPNEKFFRLMMASLAYLRSGERTAAGVVRGQCESDVWTTVTYFALWSVRLAGIFPELRLKSESVEIAEEMLQKPLAALTPRAWSKGTAADLRRALVKTLEQHVERKFLTVPLLEAL